jgi:diguanylate cyclase (GGDEF)-like protein/hemerythrin-like metal-binding protein
MIISSLMALLVIYDNYFDLSIVLKKENAKYLIVAKSVVGIYLIITIARIIFAITTFKSEGLLIEDSLFTTITNMFIFISINIWSMMILSADYAKLQSMLEHQNDELKRLALKDSLTGLYNRHFLEQEIDKYTQIAKVYNQPLSFIMFDLDNFKIVNDVYGHDYGDEVLIKLAEVTRNSIRTSDIAYRWGGEEFLIVLPNTPVYTANEVAEGLRLAVKEAFTEKAGQVTISLGVSEYKSTDSSQSWFRRADYGLSQAKKSGKDKVVVWPTHQPLPLAFATVDWQESWNSGHLEIDKQHKELIQLSNELAHIALERENIEKVLNQLQTIMTHVITHFHYEESVLFEVGYDQYEIHKAEHNALIERFQKLLEDAKANKVSIKQCFDQIAGTLIIGHLLHYDKLFFSLFNE